MKIIGAAIIGTTLLLTSAAFAQSGMVADECESEINQYCSGLKHGQGAVRQCLEDHRSALSQHCKAALLSSGPGNGMGMGGKALTSQDVMRVLEDQGYTDIRDVEREGGHFEVKALDPAGHRKEVYVDALTGKIIGHE